MINSNKILTLLFILIIALASYLPILSNTHYNILDDARVYDSIVKFDVANKNTFLKLPDQGGRARPGMLFLCLPALGHTNPFIHYFIQTTLFLFVPLLIIFWLVNKITENKYLALICSLCCLCVPPIVQNYYTLFKAETHILFGTLLFTALLWQIYFRKDETKIYNKLLFGTIGILATILTYTIKETGIAYFGVYCLGILNFTLFTKKTWKNSLYGSIFLSILNLFAVCIVLYFYSQLETTYSSSSKAGFSLKIPDIISGIYRIFNYFTTTASYVFPAFLMWLLSFFIFIKDKVFRDKLKIKLAWLSYFLLFFVGMISILIPWTGLVIRYYLVASVGAVIFAFLAIDIGLYNIKFKKNKSFNIILVFAILILLISHSVYCIAVGDFSEGNVRQNVDKTYYDVFKYISKVTPPNGTAYFMIGKEQKEARKNTITSLKIFYNRPDIKCVFPEKVSDLNQPGLLCVTDMKRPPCFNYTRVVANESGRGMFLKIIQSTLHLREVWQTVYSTPIIYATNHWAVPQYKSKICFPDFWDLKKGVYEFGWKVYEFNGSQKWKSKYKKNMYKRQPIEWKSLDNNIEPLPVCSNFQNVSNMAMDVKNYKPKEKLIILSEIPRLSNLRVVVYGDSIARAVAFGENAWHQKVLRWLNNKLENCDVNLINNAMSGDSTLQLVSRVYPDVIAKRPHIVLLLTTRSEKWQYDTYYQRLRWIVKTIKDRGTAQVVLLSMPPSLRDEDNKNDIYYNTSIQKIAKELSCGLVNLDSGFKNSKYPLKELLFTDLRHPNDKGQEAIANAVIEFLKKSMSLKSSDFRWNQWNILSSSDNWTMNPKSSDCFATFQGDDGGKLSVNFTGTWIAVNFNTNTCGGSDVIFQIDGKSPNKLAPLKCFATTPIPRKENANNGRRCFGGDYQMYRPTRFFCGTNAVAEEWTLNFSSPDVMSVSGSVTGFDGIFTNPGYSTKLVFSNSKKVALRPYDVWWAVGMKLYCYNDVFRFNTVPVGKNNLSELEFDESNTIVAHLSNGLHKLDIIVKNSSRPVNLIINSIECGKNLDVDFILENVLQDVLNSEIQDKSEFKIAHLRNLIKNSTFDDNINSWNYWQTASKHTNYIEEIHKGIRILNPNAQLIGLKQHVPVVSGQVYRLSGSVRSTVTNNPNILFGGRLAFWQKGQKEKQIVWMSEFNQWWKKELIFTNQVTGMATVYIHMGYGNVSSTGEFTNISLEEIK